MKQIGIIIRTLNEAHYLGKTIDRIKNQNFSSKPKIVVVDSGSIDNTLKIAKTKKVYKIIKISKNDFTFGKAINIGIEALPKNTNFVIILSAHSIPCSSSWMENLIRPLDDKSVAGCFGKQIPHNKHLKNKITMYQYKNWYNSIFSDKSYVSKINSNFSNANSVIRYNCWKYNNFDEIVSGSEDVLWAKKLIENGYKIAYSHSASVYHSHSENIIQFYRRIKRENIHSISNYSLYMYLRSRYLLIRKIILKIRSLITHNKNFTYDLLNIIVIEITIIFAKRD